VGYTPLPAVSALSAISGSTACELHHRISFIYYRISYLSFFVKSFFEKSTDTDKKACNFVSAKARFHEKFLSASTKKLRDDSNAIGIRVTPDYK